MVLVELVWEVEEGGVVELSLAAVLWLSSCLRLGIVFLTLSGVGLLGLL